MEFEVGIVVFLVAVIVSRIISKQALNELSSDQKAKLLDSFSAYQAYGLIPLVLMIVVYFVLERFTEISLQTLVIGYFLALIAYIVWNYFYTRRRLKTLELPEAYMSKFGIARAIQYVGLGLFLAVVITSGF